MCAGLSASVYKLWIVKVPDLQEVRSLRASKWYFLGVATTLQKIFLSFPDRHSLWWRFEKLEDGALNWIVPNIDWCHCFYRIYLLLTLMLNFCIV